MCRRAVIISVIVNLYEYQFILVKTPCVSSSGISVIVNLYEYGFTSGVKAPPVIFSMKVDI